MHTWLSSFIELSLLTTKLCSFKYDNPSIVHHWITFLPNTITTTFCSIASQTGLSTITRNVQNVRRWHSHMLSVAFWNSTLTYWLALAASRPKSTAVSLLGLRSCLVSAAICGISPAWHPRHDSPADSDLESLETNGPSRWIPGYLPVASLAQFDYCLLNRLRNIWRHQLRHYLFWLQAGTLPAYCSKNSR